MKQNFTALLVALTILCLNANGQASGPVSHWPFNGNPLDTTGNVHHGTLHNVTLTTGRNGLPNSAYLFSGVGSYISAPFSPAWNVTQYSIGAVVKSSAFNTDVCQGNYIISRGHVSLGRVGTLLQRQSVQRLQYS